MKRFLPLFIIALAFSSCQEDLKTNNPGFQALKDDVLWRATDTRATISSTGKLTIKAYTAFEQVTLTTSSTAIGSYTLGSVNTDNSASYTSSFNNNNLEYATIPALGPAYTVTIINSGSGYSADCVIPANATDYVCNSSHQTSATTGSGSGLTVALTTNASGQVNSIIRIVSPGNGYMPGDVVTVASGNLNCKLRIENVRNSNGTIQITNFDSTNMTITGKFKCNAINTNNNPFGEPVMNFQYGDFYKIPIYPEL